MLTFYPDIDIITAEAMTLAHQLATGQMTTHDAIDDAFNKRTLRDRDGLPDWFLDDETTHDKPQKPITKAAAKAIQEKMRAYNQEGPGGQGAGEVQGRAETREAEEEVGCAG